MSAETGIDVVESIYPCKIRGMTGCVGQVMTYDSFLTKRENPCDSSYVLVRLLRSVHVNREGSCSTKKGICKTCYANHQDKTMSELQEAVGKVLSVGLVYDWLKYARIRCLVLVEAGGAQVLI